MTYLLTSAGGKLAQVARKAPALLLNTALLTVCGIWLSVDLDRIKEAARQALPKGLCEKLFSTIGNIRDASAKYAKAHILIFAITIAETYTALVIMNIPYALALSVAIAAVDILPLLGAGIILLPWAAIALLFGNIPTGAGLLITLGLLWITKQLAEPYVLGKGLGVHPFFTFVATVTGILLFGPTGAITLPLFLSLLQKAKN